MSMGGDVGGGGCESGGYQDAVPLLGDRSEASCDGYKLINLKSFNRQQSFACDEHYLSAF